MIKANIGLRLHDSKPGTLSERSLSAASQGFRCVHLALSKVLGSGFMDPMVFTPGLAAHVRSSMNGLDIAVLGCYLNLCTPDESEYACTVEEHSHTDEALEMFIRRVEPVVKAAEKLGALLAIEPVYTHIVSTPKRARRVLDAVASPNLRIIFDPVNLLHPDNLSRRDEVIAEAIELLGKEIDIIHIKDYILREDGKLDSVAAGTGEMDFSAILRFAARVKPGIQMTLENTVPENAENARIFVDRAYNEQAQA